MRRIWGLAATAALLCLGLTGCIPRAAPVVATPVVAAVRDITAGGAHVSIDALGHPTTCYNSISCLRRRGRHVQVGLMLGDHANPAIPMSRVIGHELEIYGSHGMQAWRYDAMLDMLAAGKIAPQKLIGKRIGLEQAVEPLMAMDRSDSIGITVIEF